MRFVTPIDRALQAGGKPVTFAFLLVAAAGAVVIVYTDLPLAVGMALSGGGATIHWMRFKNITVAGLVRRIRYTRARDGDITD